MLRPLALALLVFSVAAALPAAARGRVPASAKARPAEEVKAERVRAYETARADLAELGADRKRRSLRHHWLNLARRFDAMGERKDHPRRCEALFTGARLFAELAEVSYLEADRREAADRFRRVSRACPTSNLADDGLLRAAELLAPTDPAAARFELDRLLKAHGDGDQVRKARELLAGLKPEKRAAPKDVVARPAPARAGAAGPEPAKGKADPVRKDAAPATAARPASADEASRIAAGAPLRGEPPGPAVPKTAPARDGAGTSVIEEILASAGAPASVSSPAGAAPAEKAGQTGVAEKPEPTRIAEKPEPTRVAEKPEPTRVAEKPEPTRVAEKPEPTRAAAEPPAPRREDRSLDGDRLDRLAAIDRADRDLTLSTVAGLKVRRVVIDPGHGGRDAGAIGKAGTRESKITLAIAKKLRARLQTMGLEVLLTRDDDSTLSLEARTAFANERRADLFLSIHCNAAKSRKLRGVETYTLNLNSDRYAVRLAARENAGSERALGDLQFILADLATKANTDDSVRLAGSIHAETVSRLSRRWDGVRDLGTKQALFFVLLGAKMPAVLFEASFLSHPEEEQRLRTDAYQDELAAGIAEGVRRFISEREAVARAPSVLE